MAARFNELSSLTHKAESRIVCVLKRKFLSTNQLITNQGLPQLQMIISEDWQDEGDMLMLESIRSWTQDARFDV